MNRHIDNFDRLKVAGLVHHIYGLFCCEISVGVSYSFVDIYCSIAITVINCNFLYLI